MQRNAAESTEPFVVTARHSDWKFDGLRLIPPSAYHERQSTSPSVEL